MRSFVELEFQSFFAPSGFFAQRLTDQLVQFGANPLIYQLLREVSAGYQVTEDALVLDLNSKGPLSKIADAVAALFRRNKLRDSTATEACRILCDAYSSRSQIELDTTGTFRVVADTPWETLKQ